MNVDLFWREYRRVKGECILEAQTNIEAGYFANYLSRLNQDIVRYVKEPSDNINSLAHALAGLEAVATLISYRKQNPIDQTPDRSPSLGV